MSWRYSAASYTPRDRSSSRDSSTSKFGISSPSSSYSAADRPSRWSSSTSTREPVSNSRSTTVEEHGPVWARTSLHTSPSSLVQRLKDKYSTADTKPSPPPVRRGETKELSLPIARTYGRTLTSAYTGRSSQIEPKQDEASGKSNATTTQETEKNPTGVYTSRASFRKKTPEPEKSYSGYEYKTRVPDYTPLESKPKIYTSSSLGSSPATSRYLSNKKGSGSSASSSANTPTTPGTDRNFILEKFEKAHQQEMQQSEKTVTVVTRGTSPSQPSSSIYVRTRRSDSTKGIERTITRPRVSPQTADKSCQAEEVPEKNSKLFGTYETDRVKPRASYLASSTISLYPSFNRYTARTSSIAPVSSRNDYRRSVSKDRESEPQRESKEYSSSKGPPVSYTPISSRSEYRRSVSKDREKDTFTKERDYSFHKGAPAPPPVSYTPVTSKYNSEYRRSVSRERDFTSKRQEDPPPVRSVTVRTIEAPKVVNQTTNTLSPVKSPTFSKSETSESAKTTTVPLKITSTSNSSSLSKTIPTSSVKEEISPVIIKEKSRSPNYSETRERARSKTGDSDTSVSVSGFSDAKKSKSPESKVTEIISLTDSADYRSKGTPTKQSKATESITGKKSPLSSSKSRNSLKSHVVPTSATNNNKSESPKSPVSSQSQIKESSESESESDETDTTTTESDTADEAEELTKSSEPSSIKRSITNFLRNRTSANDSMGSKSRLSLLKQGSTAKINFNRIESGEKAWWMDSSSHVPEGVAKLAQSSKSIPDKNHLVPNMLSNRQFSRDKDWLKNSSDEGSDRSSASPLPPRPPSTPSPHLQQSTSPTQHAKTENLYLDVPKFPIIRQWSDEKPWWQQDDEDKNQCGGSEICDEQKSGDYVCDSTSNVSPVKSLSGKLTADENKTGEDEEGLDVTPALRRRRELQQAGYVEEPKEPDPIHFAVEAPEDELEKPFLNECKLECSVRDLTQKLAAFTNGIPSPVEEKPGPLEAEGMSGMISRAKADLIKSQTKQLREESEEQPQPLRDFAKSEIDIYWKELVDSLDRQLLLGDMDFTDLNSEDEQDSFGTIRVNGGIPPPPPTGLLNGPVPPPTPANPPPPIRGIQVPPPPSPPIVKNKKTVKLFWKEVVDQRFAESGKANSIWNEIFPVSVDHSKLEHLFESRAKDLITKKQQEQSRTKAIVVLDNKRSNAINIGMTKLPPARAIKAAILKMDSSVVTKEGIEKLLAMLPTEEEQMRIQDAQTASPELPLGTAEQFLLTLASITELEARLRLWAFKLDYENSEKEICEPLQDLKQGIQVLRSNKTFRGILSTLLSIGNFLNGQEAKGFQIDYLSKVPEVKDTVNKHSLIHHLCVFVMENFPDSTDLYSEIGAVTRASKTDFDELTTNIKKLEDDCKCSWNHLKIIAKHEGQTAMKAKMSDFLADCAERIILIGIVHRRVMCRFRKFIVWLGVPMNRITTTRPHELFKTVSEFALEYRTTRERIIQQIKRVTHHREKSRSRINVPLEAQTTSKQLNSKEAKEDAKLRQLLDQGPSSGENFNNTITWRRQKKSRPTASNELQGDDSEIIETLIKTAKQPPASRSTLQERRRSRIVERKNNQS